MRLLASVVKLFALRCVPAFRMLRYLNPFALWLDYKRQRDAELDRQRAQERMERAEERELFRQTIASMSVMVEKAFEANRANSEVFNTFLEGFKTDSAPQVREFDEDAELRRYFDKQNDTPEELKGLSQIDQFKALMDKMEKFEAGI